MDKKAKKRIEVLNKRLKKLQTLLTGAKEQMDDPEEVNRLEAEIAKDSAELTKLKNS